MSNDALRPEFTPPGGHTKVAVITHLTSNFIRLCDMQGRGPIMSERTNRLKARDDPPSPQAGQLLPSLTERLSRPQGICDNHKNTSPHANF